MLRLTKKTFKNFYHKLQVAFEFNRFIDYYKGSKDINANEKGSKDGKRGDRNRNVDGNSTRFHLNIGEDQGLNKGALVRLICDNANITSKEIGRIDMRNEFCFFEVESEISMSVFDAMKSSEFDGQSVRIELAKERKGGDRSRGRGRDRDRGGNGGKRSFERR